MERSIDHLDWKIIGILQKDGRTPNSEIARKLGVAEGTVRRRLERLVNEDILRIAAVTDPFKVGIGIVALMHLDVELACLESVGEKLSEMPCVRVVALTTGVHDIIVEALFPSQQDLLEFLRDQLPQIPGIRNSETSILLSILKRTYEWEIPPIEDLHEEAKPKADGRES